MLTETGFGYIIVDGKKYNHDIVVYPDGEIKKRRKDLSKKYRRIYNHTPLSREELEYYLKEAGTPELIIIGSGQYGVLPLTREAEEYLRKLESKGVRVIIDKTPNILQLVNELLDQGKKMLAIIHVTC